MAGLGSVREEWRINSGRCVMVHLLILIMVAPTSSFPDNVIAL